MRVLVIGLDGVTFDLLGPWMTRGNLSEAGFYAAVKISPWPKNMSKGGKGGNGKKKGGRGMDCYDF